MSGDAGRERSVRCLQELYTVVVGVALALAVSRVVRSQGFPINTAALPAFVAFIVTLIPFYTGTMRHFERSYLETEASDSWSGALLTDFLLKFVEACGFLAVAELLQRPVAASWGLLFLLTYNTVWGVIVQTALRERGGANEVLWWGLINVLTAVLLLSLLLFAGGSIDRVSLSVPLGVGLVLLTIARTALDYATCWFVYFPGPRPSLRGVGYGASETGEKRTPADALA